MALESAGPLFIPFSLLKNSVNIPWKLRTECKELDNFVFWL